LGIHLRDWYGAESNSSAVMKKNKVPDHYPMVRCVDVPEQQLWAHHAFFGGRIETIMQGVQKDGLHNYDLSSAYPSALLDFPRMTDGTWKYRNYVKGRRAKTLGQNVIDITKLNKVQEKDGRAGFILYQKTDGQLEAMQRVLGRRDSSGDLEDDRTDTVLPGHRLGRTPPTAIE
jgi:hypothetical protein